MQKPVAEQYMNKLIFFIEKKGPAIKCFSFYIENLLTCVQELLMVVWLHIRPVCIMQLKN
jgi:hypothetical protein